MNSTCCSELQFNSFKSPMLTDKADSFLHERLVWCVVGSYFDMTNTPFSSSALLVAAKLVMLTIPFPAAQQDLGWDGPFSFQTLEPSKLPSKETLITMNRDLSMSSYCDQVTIPSHFIQSKTDLATICSNVINHTISQLQLLLFNITSNVP